LRHPKIGCAQLAILRVISEFVELCKEILSELSVPKVQELADIFDENKTRLSELHESQERLV